MTEQDMSDIKRAIRCFMFSERIKSELIIASRLLWVIEEMKGEELIGAKKVMSSFLDAMVTEINTAYNVVKMQNFEQATIKVMAVKERVAADQYQEATISLSEAISSVTTCGHRAVEALREKDLF